VASLEMGLSNAGEAVELLLCQISGSADLLIQADMAGPREEFWLRPKLKPAK
jgi:hypothetical protein